MIGQGRRPCTPAAVSPLNACGLFVGAQRLERAQLPLQHRQRGLGGVTPLCLARQDALAQLRGAGLRREDLKRQAQFVGERAKGIAVGAR